MSAEVRTSEVIPVLSLRRISIRVFVCHQLESFNAISIDRITTGDFQWNTLPSQSSPIAGLQLLPSCLPSCLRPSLVMILPWNILYESVAVRKPHKVSTEGIMWEREED